MSETSNKIDFPKVSMDIIVNAGEARNAAIDAMAYTMSDSQEKADEALKKAKESIKEAHRAQTEVMQTLAFSEYNNGECQESLPMLFIHAQDTIMTIMTEVNITEQMINMYRKLKEEINACKK